SVLASLVRRSDPAAGAGLPARHCRFLQAIGGPPRAARRPGGAAMSLLQVRDLKKAFGGNVAVDGIQFDLHAGEFLALIGPNGAGKTTTFNMVGGQLAPTAGSVRLEGQELVGLAPRRIAALGVGRTFQIAATFASLTVVE